MNDFNVVVIEDEIPAARLLKSMITALRPQWNITIVPGSVDEAIDWFAVHRHPDLIFLDINLSDGNAFDFLTMAKPTSAIVFTTAYDEYAIRAFSVNSIDYILKPVDEQRLTEAIEKYEDLYSHYWQSSDDYINRLLYTLKSGAQRYRQRFLIAGRDSYRSLQVDCVAYFYSESKVTFAVTPSGKEYAVNLSLSKLEAQLDPNRFFRVNRQMILNIDSVECAIPLSKGRIKVKVQPAFKSDIIVSDGRASYFRLWLDF
ncbi:MAG: LytR/AlgR family response regulator transcription factor [Muribaculaceae bacterium]